MTGRVAVVTGAGSGIGRATALRLHRDGWDVAVLDISADDGEATARMVGGDRIAGYVADVSDPEAVEATVAAVVDRQGAPALLVNNAGIGLAADTPSTTTDAWRRTFGVNVEGTFYMCRAVLPSMLASKRGVIVNVASVAGLVGLKNRAAYCASKAAVIGLTRAIAADHAADGIRANAIAPGTVETSWIGKILSNAEDPVATRAAMQARQLDGVMGTAEEVAAGISFLASAESRFVNGSVFVMDGGLTAV
jgi:NAD(P)-dependent dehydrogenase (short-subunit alcohol dehydrogenase family)